MFALTRLGKLTKNHTSPTCPHSICRRTLSTALSAAWREIGDLDVFSRFACQERLLISSSLCSISPFVAASLTTLFHSPIASFPLPVLFLTYCKNSPHSFFSSPARLRC